MIRIALVVPHFDQDLAATLQTAADQPMVLFASSLSWLSRNPDTWMRVVEFLGTWKLGAHHEWLRRSERTADVDQF